MYSCKVMYNPGESCTSYSGPSTTIITLSLKEDQYKAITVVVFLPRRLLSCETVQRKGRNMNELADQGFASDWLLAAQLPLPGNWLSTGFEARECRTGDTATVLQLQYTCLVPSPAPCGGLHYLMSTPLLSHSIFLNNNASFKTQGSR